MTEKYSKWSYKGPPNFTQSRIFGLKRNHLATQHQSKLFVQTMSGHCRRFSVRPGSTGKGVFFLLQFSSEMSKKKRLTLTSCRVSGLIASLSSRPTRAASDPKRTEGPLFFAAI
jgi:hypothetical protein